MVRTEMENVLNFKSIDIDLNEDKRKCKRKVSCISASYIKNWKVQDKHNNVISDYERLGLIRCAMNRNKCIRVKLTLLHKKQLSLYQTLAEKFTNQNVKVAILKI